MLLSGIQHFTFCRRQWALIHIEQLWEDNARTVDGNILHKHVHDAEYTSKRGNVLTVRALKIHSPRLGLSGECDAVEFYQSKNGIELKSYSGNWIPYPVEYKKGKPKEHDADKLQLCAEAMCLEEMLCCHIEKGALYYGEPHHRQEVVFSQELRDKVCETVKEMHDLYRRGYTPKVKMTKSCNACSLKDLCMPKLMKKASVREYMKQAIDEDMT